ncbi:MAG: uroporphyrinogen decarboxylase family protein [Anaerolineales bacterium]|nr:uroporphyrinogen decarboxylase family protein [Anaerolineales bacterium]
MTTHRERIQACLDGEQTDRAPVALWRHFPVDDQNPETLAAAALHFQSAYDFDIVKVTPASSFAVKDWGVEDEWRGDSEGSRKYIRRAIQHPRDWESLGELTLSAPHLAAQLECLRLIRKGLGADTPLIQTIFNPMSQAKNLAGNEMLLEHLREHPEAVMKGLETIALTTKKFIEAAMEIGIDGIFYAVQHAQKEFFTLDEYKKFALPFDKKTLEPAKDLWCNMIHLHGKDVHFSLANELKFQIVNWHDRETYPSLTEARELFKDMTLCGGLRQDSLVFEDQHQIKKDAADAIQQTQGSRFILGTGCVTHITAAHGNLMAARKSVEC